MAGKPGQDKTPRSLSGWDRTLVGVVATILLVFGISVLIYHDPALYLTDKYGWHVKQAQKLYSLGKFDQALEQTEKAISEDPGATGAYEARASIFIRSGRTDDAERELAMLDDRTALYHSYLGLVRRQQGRIEESLAHHENALSLDPWLIDSYLDAAVDSMLLGNLDDAALYLEQGLERLEDPQARPTLSRTPEANLRAARSILYEIQGREEESVRELEKAISLDPESFILISARVKTLPEE